MRKSESCIGLRHLFMQIRHYSQVRHCKDASSKSKFAVCAVFASAWHWRDCERAVRRGAGGAACVACKLEVSIGCFPSLCCSHFLPPVDSQAVLSVWRRQHILAWQQQVYTSGHHVMRFRHVCHIASAMCTWELTRGSTGRNPKWIRSDPLFQWHNNQNKIRFY